MLSGILAFPSPSLTFHTDQISGKINETGFLCTDGDNNHAVHLGEIVNHSHNLLFQLLPIANFVYIARGPRNHPMPHKQIYANTVSVKKL